VHAACVDFSHHLDIPHCRARDNTLAFFPGSSIGNFEPPQAVRLMADIAALVGRGGHLLIGVDLKKDIRTLNAAYNDAAGVTAEFNRNLLWRMRHELDADLDPNAFSHYAFYNPGPGRIEMHLVSDADTRVGLDGTHFELHAGETIHTENSYKYTVQEFTALADRAGFAPRAVWTDPRGLFSVHLLQAG
jgi:dimethylhistidine N-methyltransferase